MRSDKYLGELGMELRLRLPEDVSADLVAQIAGHLEDSGANPVDEFGEPHELAAELVAGHGQSKRRMVERLLLSVGSFAALLLSLTLFGSGGTIESGSLAPILVQSVLIGGVVMVVRGKVRAGFRNGEPGKILALCAAAFVIAGVTGFLFSWLDFEVTVGAPNLVAAFLLAAALIGIWFLYRPLPFDKKSGLKANALTGYVEPKS